MPDTTFLRLLAHDDKPAALAAAVAALREGEECPDVFAADPAFFQQVPGATFAYWVPVRVRQLFTKVSLFEAEDRIVPVGDHPGDGFRYLRLYWEISAGNKKQLEIVSKRRKLFATLL